MVFQTLAACAQTCTRARKRFTRRLRVLPSRRSAGLASDEQQSVWLQRLVRMEIVVAYAQTELGHGSNLRGLETTATFDRAADEFVLHSPTISSTKVSTSPL